MFRALVLWTLWCVSTHTAVCGRSTGQMHGGIGQDDGLPSGAGSRKLRRVKERIIGGQDAPKERFPYACSLRALGTRSHRCGGTLIAPEWVLTAAHCLVGEDSLGSKPLVYVGAHGIDDTDFAEVILAAEVIIHESFKERAEDGFDIALVRLERPSALKQPVNLAPADQFIAGGQFLVVAGWGRTSDRGPLPRVLQFSDQIEAISNENCVDAWPFLQDNMMCAFASTQAACEGDSGGPLLLADSKEGIAVAEGNPGFDFLVGIVSFGPEKCNSVKPDGYTRVSSFRDWIDAALSGNPPRAPSTPPARPTPVPTSVSSPAASGASLRVCTKNCEGLDRELYLAAGAPGNLARVKEALSKGADVTSMENRGETALHNAARHGQAEIAEVLIAAGADTDIQALPESTNPGSTPLHIAAGRSKSNVVKVLAEAGAALDIRNDDGFTPLGVAANAGVLDAVEILLASGADVNKQNSKTGASPLHTSAGKGLVDVAKALVAAGAALNTRDNNGSTPLILAGGKSGNPDIVRLLVNAGAETDVQNQQGETAMILASFFGTTKSVDILIAAGADPGIKDFSGKTASERRCACREATLEELQCRAGRCR